MVFLQVVVVVDSRGRIAEICLDHATTSILVGAAG